MTSGYQRVQTTATQRDIIVEYARKNTAIIILNALCCCCWDDKKLHNDNIII